MIFDNTTESATMWYDMIQFWLIRKWYDICRYHWICYNAIWYGMIWYNTIQFWFKRQRFDICWCHWICYIWYNAILIHKELIRYLITRLNLLQCDMIQYDQYVTNFSQNQLIWTVMMVMMARHISLKIWRFFLHTSCLSFFW